MMNISEIQEENMSNLTTSASNEASVSSTGGGEIYPPSYTVAQAPPAKKRRNQPGHPDPGSEVIALSPRTLMATNRFVCEICSKGFQREQNLQLHRRGHNLPWKLKQRNGKDVRKKVYICPVTTCVHHEASRALGDLTGIKKHFCRKHGEKKWKCEKCSKKYAVQSDWKAHSKTCGTREYKCDCGTLFSRRDSFTTHRAFCDALAEESANSISGNSLSSLSHHINLEQIQSHFSIKKEQQHLSQRPPWLACPSSIFQDHDHHPNPNPNMGPTTTVPSFHHPPPHMSATALLQKAAEMGSTPPSPAGVFSRLPHHAAHVSADESGTAGFGLKLSSRDQFINGLAPFGNKAAAGGTATACTTNPSSPSLLVHEMLINNPGFRHHDDFSFAGILNKKAQETLDFHATLDHFSTSNGCNDDGMMTRDFLGLRPLSQNDILNFAALSNCINTSSCNEHQSQTERSWQG